ncbi:MAG: hypothetical protein IJT27_04260 [Clostridia bacterium]|nr:hypothetical protein [Clostridia bacterium]
MMLKSGDKTGLRRSISGFVGRLFWRIDKNDRILTVRCDGVMPNLFSDRPWT